ncbi:hypothetical protein GGF32_009368 [Allomyces javanicus]|nr:hypothetical protein GGF32_009368 [Allomyces javanicus]
MVTWLISIVALLVISWIVLDERKCHGGFHRSSQSCNSIQASTTRIKRRWFASPRLTSKSDGRLELLLTSAIFLVIEATNALGFTLFTSFPVVPIWPIYYTIRTLVFVPVAGMSLLVITLRVSALCFKSLAMQERLWSLSALTVAIITPCSIIGNLCSAPHVDWSRNSAEDFGTDWSSQLLLLINAVFPVAAGAMTVCSMHAAPIPLFWASGGEGTQSWWRSRHFDVMACCLIVESLFKLIVKARVARRADGANDVTRSKRSTTKLAGPEATDSTDHTDSITSMGQLAVSSWPTLATFSAARRMSVDQETVHSVELSLARTRIGTTPVSNGAQLSPADGGQRGSKAKSFPSATSKGGLHSLAEDDEIDAGVGDMEGAADTFHGDGCKPGPSHGAITIPPNEALLTRIFIVTSWVLSLLAFALVINVVVSSTSKSISSRSIFSRPSLRRTNNKRGDAATDTRAAQFFGRRSRCFGDSDGRLELLVVAAVCVVGETTNALITVLKAPFPVVPIWPEYYTARSILFFPVGGLSLLIITLRVSSLCFKSHTVRGRMWCAAVAAVVLLTPPFIAGNLLLAPATDWNKSTSSQSRWWSVLLYVNTIFPIAALIMTAYSIEMDTLAACIRAGTGCINELLDATRRITPRSTSNDKSIQTALGTTFWLLTSGYLVIWAAQLAYNTFATQNTFLRMAVTTSFTTCWLVVETLFKMIVRARVRNRRRVGPVAAAARQKALSSGSGEVRRASIGSMGQLDLGSVDELETPQAASTGRPAGSSGQRLNEH